MQRRNFLRSGFLGSAAVIGGLQLLRAGDGLEFEEAGVLLEEEIKLNLNPDTDELMLGDIVICCERMEAQAQEFGHSILREYAFLIAHSMFHLMGYDHMTTDEEQRMFQKQDLVLNNLGITRGV